MVNGCRDGEDDEPGRRPWVWMRSPKTSKLLCEQQGGTPRAHRPKVVRRGEALRPVRESEVIGPGWTQAASTDHTKHATDGKVRQLQGFDQVLHRWRGFGIAGGLQKGG